MGYPSYDTPFDGLAKVLDQCHLDSFHAGWWETPDGKNLRAEARSGSPYGAALVAQKIALIHSEVSEAMEGHRKGLPDDHLPDRSMIEVELADALIRIGDLAGALGLDVAGAVREKLAYNKQRLDHKKSSRQAAGGKSY